MALIQTPRYSYGSTVHDGDFEMTDASIANFAADDLDGLNVSLKDGVHTFTPTAAVLGNFEDFLQRVENISGREVGVVKVILPRELLVICRLDSLKPIKLTNVKTDFV